MKNKKMGLNKFIKALSLCFIATFIVGAFAITSFAASHSDLNGCAFDFSNILCTVVAVDDEHEHVFTNYVSNNDATCDTDGTKTAKCELCDETDTITDEGSAGHRFTSYVSDNNATCDTDGTKTAKCELCDETDTITDEDSAGHKFTSYVSDNNATCDIDGTKTAKCELCDETDTITDEGSAGHKFTTYIPDKNATCTRKGTKTAKCDNCDVTHTVEGDSTLAHTYKLFRCTGCGDVLLSRVLPIAVGAVVAVFFLFFMRFDYVFRRF